ncbi:MAG: stage V sporulation protein AB [Clostridiales bacterium]|nr:stage V sporulation protein AB [Clostridiales bacterium]
MSEMIVRVLLGWTALAAGFATAAGFIAFISLIGIVPRLSALTKTAKYIPLYENCLALGLISMNLISLYHFDFSGMFHIMAVLLLAVGGLFTGIFVGCLAGALAEVVNIIPIFSRRIRLRKGMPYFIIAAAIGKCIGSLMQFFLFPR